MRARDDACLLLLDVSYFHALAAWRLGLHLRHTAWHLDCETVSMIFGSPRQLSIAHRCPSGQILMSHSLASPPWCAKAKDDVLVQVNLHVLCSYMRLLGRDSCLLVLTIRRMYKNDARSREEVMTRSGLDKARRSPHLNARTQAKKEDPNSCRMRS